MAHKIDRKTVAERIARLSKEAHLEVFFLLKNECTMTKNQNGFFFDIQSLNDPTFEKLCEMVGFFYENEKKLSESYNQLRTQRRRRDEKTVKA